MKNEKTCPLAPSEFRGAGNDERTGVNGAKYLYCSIESPRQNFVFIFIYKGPELKKGKKKKKNTTRGSLNDVRLCNVVINGARRSFY